MAALGIVLQRANCMLLCVAIVVIVAIGASEADNEQSKREAFMIVNDYLESHSPDNVISAPTGGWGKKEELPKKNSSFRENIELLRSYIKSEDFAQVKNGQMRDIAQMITELNREDMCEVQNLKNMWQIADGLTDIVPEVRLLLLDKNCPKGLHLGCVVRRYILVSIWRCLFPVYKRFGTNFGTDNVANLTADYEVYLKWFDDVNVRSVTKDYKSGDKEMDMFYGVLSYSPSSEVDEYAGSLVSYVITMTNYALTRRPSLAGDAKTGEPVRPSQELATRYLDRYLIEPCEEMLQTVPIRNEVLPVIELLLTVNLAKMPVGVTKKESVYLWAARTMNCQWVLNMDKAKLVEAIVATEPIDMEKTSWFDNIANFVQKFVPGGN